MSDHTHIEWTDATWNPITGCSVISAGCKHCYAMRLAGTRLRHHRSRVGLTRPPNPGPLWTGQVRLNEDWLDQPLRWKKPRRIFVCAHGDLFHGAVPDEWIDRVFAVMALAPQHTFQVLTKRPARALVWMRNGRSKDVALWHWKVGPDSPSTWPLGNVWLGVSVEDQTTADERIPLLLQTPAAVRFVSAEPLLGPVRLPFARLSEWNRLARESGQEHAATTLDWVICGGESGPGARPAHPDWFRSLRDQCQAANVPFFFKQWGEWLPMLGHAEGVPVRGDKYTHPDGTIMGRAGKRAAGRRLDGRTWDEFPRSAP
jgi:protein gp37